MPHDDFDDPDEDWYDEDGDVIEDSAEEKPGGCPECGGAVYEFADRCPACGYWLTAADRRRIWRADSKPNWVILTALLILAVFVIGSLTLYF